MLISKELVSLMESRGMDITKIMMDRKQWQNTPAKSLARDKCPWIEAMKKAKYKK